MAVQQVVVTTPARRVPREAFTCFWGAYAISIFGTFFAFDAFALVAILALNAGPAAVSALAAAGPAVGAIAALPLGPWVDRRRKRAAMITADVVRFTALATVPLAFVLGWLSWTHLVVVAVLVAAGDIAFKGASGAFVRDVVRKDELVAANARLESTMWTATLAGPPLGGAAMTALGPVVGVAANAASFLASAAALSRIDRAAESPPASPSTGSRWADLTEGWRCILAHPTLRPLLLNTALTNALILATAPLMAVLMLDELGFEPWQYALAFGLPCVGGIVGSRLAPPLVAQFGQARVLRIAGTVRACWPIGLAAVAAGPTGIALVLLLQTALLTSIGVFNPVFAAVRLNAVERERTARVLIAWSVTTSATIAGAIAIFGLIAAATSPRAGVALAGALLLATPLLLPRRLDG
ncbi:MAG: MFS transporter [Solirubrobacteraceae bacterium]|nr:MFS transporter [Solirubrobacteraceae bacterium]